MGGSVLAEWSLVGSKSGIAKLLKPYENSLSDVVKITKALGFATRVYSKNKISNNEVKASGEPFILHPLRVALILSEELRVRDIDLICAALLHKTVDGGDSKEVSRQLRQEFGDRVADIVTAVSKPKAEKEEKEKVLNEYFKSIANSPADIRFLKLADRLDNVRTMKNALQRDRALRYKEETQKYVIPIAEKTDEKFVFKLSVALYELK